VTGDLGNPRIAGHLRAGNFTFSDEHVDALEADVVAASDYLRVQNATASQGPLRAQFQGSVGLSQWKTGETSPIAATATLKNAALSDLAALLHSKDLPVTGTLNGSAQVNGTIATPRVQADLELLKGTLRDQPFDRFTAHAGYAANTLTVTNGQLVAGAKQVRLSGTYQHQADHLDTGRLRFDVSSNVMAQEEIGAIAELHPGIKGTLQVTAGGQVELQPATKAGYRIDELHADIAALGVQIEGQPLGDAHLTANSQGLVLRVHGLNARLRVGIRLAHLRDVRVRQTRLAAAADPQNQKQAGRNERHYRRGETRPASHDLGSFPRAASVNRVRY